MSQIAEALESSGFRLVYQGGHHSVYCDGKEHASTDGGATLYMPQTREVMERYACDCAKWVAPHG